MEEEEAKRQLGSKDFEEAVETARDFNEQVKVWGTKRGDTIDILNDTRDTV